MERSGRDHPATATKHLDLLVDEKEPRKDIERLLEQVRPLWKPAEIKLKIFTSGITNRLVGCYVDCDMEEVVLVRIYGNMTELYVDHDTEVKNFQLLHAHHCSPELYCTFQNGICYEFIKGEVLDMQQLRKPSIFRLVARAMAQFHSVQSDNNYCSEPNLWTNLSKYLTLLKSSQSQITSDRRLQKNFCSSWADASRVDEARGRRSPRLGPRVNATEVSGEVLAAIVKTSAQRSMMALTDGRERICGNKTQEIASYNTCWWEPMGKNKLAIIVLCLSPAQR
ncbi:ethanolamine kinase 1-like [Leucoraja erinacea]|uniref:ethanolamine kinase 1-like n=1 Tax=Leucoraja erinaceus TaxID=7782 RepID=UPI002456612F|nr:ethanolamine kinase 1-like [Leucoraja erinacea]